MNALLPLISLLHPTARVAPTKTHPRGWRAAFDAFMERADYPQSVEYILSVHDSRWPVIALADSDTPERYPGIGWLHDLVKFEHHDGADNEVANLNNAAEYAQGEILMGIQDDLFPPPHWDTLLREAFADALLQIYEAPHGDLASLPLVLGFRSGSQHDGECTVAGAANRAWYARRGYVLHTDYESIGADNELTEEAKRDRIFVSCPHIRFEHRSPSIGNAEPDEIWTQFRSRATWRKGAMILERRRAAGFPRESIFLPGETLTPPASIALALPGREFHGMVQYANMALYGKLLLSGYEVDLHPFYCANVYSTRQIIAEAWQKSPTDYLLWIDSDNILTLEQFEILKKDLDDNPSLDAVAAWCWCGTEVHDTDTPPRVNCGRWHEGKPYWNASFEPREMLAKELLPIDWVGFACVLMRRECMEKVGPRPFLPILSDTIPGGFTGEDISFCHHATERGVKMAVDPRVQIPHLKFRPLVPLAVAIAHEREKQAEQARKEIAAPCDEEQPAAEAAA